MTTPSKPDPNDPSDFLWTKGSDANLNYLGHERAKYGFILETPGIQKEFIFPLNPQSIDQDEEPALTITPTVGGGKFIENYGSVFKDISITGTTGFLPIKNFRSVAGPALQAQALARLTQGDQQAAATAFSKVSGYDTFMQLRSLFREYWQIHRTGTSDVRSKTYFYWLNLKDNEVWLVEPTSFRMTRNRGSPMTYTYAIRLRTIAKGAQNLIPKDTVAVKPTNFERVRQGFLTARNRIEALNTLLNGSLSFFDQYRSIRSTLVSVIDTAGALSQQLTRLASGVADVIDLPRSLLTSAVTNISLVFQNVLNAADFIVEAPLDTLEGLTSMRQEFDFVLARADLFAESWRGTWERAVEDFATEHGIDGDTRDASLSGRNRNGLTEASPVPNETIYDLAARTTGDATRAHEIIALNNLQWPYFAPSANERTPGTVAPGDVLLVPTDFASNSNDNLVTSSVQVLGATDKDELAPSSTASVLVKAGRSRWIARQWVGYTVEMLSGPASGQQRLVVGNTEASLSLASAFSVVPVAGDLFRVFFRRMRRESRGGLEQLLGVDLAITENNVTEKWDLVRASDGDVGLVRGEANLNQALTIKFGLSQSDLLLHQWFGLRPVFGNRGTPEALLRMRLNFEATFLSDSRIDGVEQLAIEQVGDVYRTTSKLRVKGGLSTSFTSPLF
jgi:hypothetical protein